MATPSAPSASALTKSDSVRSPPVMMSVTPSASHASRWRLARGRAASVGFGGTSDAGAPRRFEAGTPNIAGVAGLGAAIEYVNAIGFDAISKCEHELLGYASERLAEIEGLRIIGTAPQKVGVISMVLDYAPPHDVATVLDSEGVAVRAGHHCAQPLMTRYGIPATARASFSIYNTREDVDRLVLALQKVRELLG